MPLVWAYGVTTCPQRRADLLPRTLESLCGAGFDAPTLFVDGTKDVAGWEAEFGLPVVARSTTIRTFGNWALALGELLIRNPTAERLAIFQDDFVTYRNLRQYLEACPYPVGGYLNLYTFPVNRRLFQSLDGRGRDRAPERLGWGLSNQLGKGAVALVFDRVAAGTLLTHPHMLARTVDAAKGWRSVDGAIVSALTKAGIKEYVHNPSLVQHTGLKSSMGNKPHRLADHWRGEDFDALKLLEETRAA